jgi:hypothetical protein
MSQCGSYMIIAKSTRLLNMHILGMEQMCPDTFPHFLRQWSPGDVALCLNIFEYVICYTDVTANIVNKHLWTTVRSWSSHFGSRCAANNSSPYNVTKHLLRTLDWQCGL